MPLPFGLEIEKVGNTYKAAVVNAGEKITLDELSIIDDSVRIVMHIFDSELKVMDVLWKDGDVPAKYVADTLNREVGWNKNTTYTLIKRCINKGAIERTEPGFMCHALIAKEQVQDLETDELIDKIYDGSVDKLFAALLGRKKLSMEQIKNLKQIVSELE